MKEKDTTLTPLSLLSALGKFDFDPCGFAGHPTAHQINVWPSDGLNVPWHGRVWLNPPYSEPEQWLKKLAEHGTGTALVLASTETKWFQDFIFPYCSAILFMRGRPKFLKPIPDGFQNVGLMRATCLVAYGEDDTKALVQSGIQGVTIFHKNILTEKHKCVNLSSPAPDGATTETPITYMKQLALVAGILATAFTQIKNVFSGEEAADPVPPKNKKPVKDGKTDTGTFNATEDEEEDLGEDDDDTAEDKVDYDKLRKECRGLMRKLVSPDAGGKEENKPKVRAVLTKLGEVNLGDARNENLAGIKTAFQKLLKA